MDYWHWSSPLAQLSSMASRRCYGMALAANFSSTFHDIDLEQAVPASLLQFVCTIEHGGNIKSQLQHWNLTFLYHNSYSTTTLPNTMREQMSTGISKTVSHLLQSMWASIYFPRRRTDKLLQCSMRMGSAYHTSCSAVGSLALFTRAWKKARRGEILYLLYFISSVLTRFA